MTAALLLALTGCSIVDLPTPEPSEDPTLGGPGLPVWSVERPVPGAPLPFTGALVVAPTGCFEVAIDGDPSRFAIWPPGSTMDGGIAIVDGRRLADGDRIEGTGAVVPVAALPDPTYWREAHLAFCAPEATDIVVIASVR